MKNHIYIQLSINSFYYTKSGSESRGKGFLSFFFFVVEGNFLFGFEEVGGKTFVDDANL